MRAPHRRVPSSQLSAFPLPSLSRLGPQRFLAALRILRCPLDPTLNPSHQRSTRSGRCPRPAFRARPTCSEREPPARGLPPANFPAPGRHAGPSRPRSSSQDPCPSVRPGPHLVPSPRRGSWGRRRRLWTQEGSESWRPEEVGGVGAGPGRGGARGRAGRAGAGRTRKSAASRPPPFCKLCSPPLARWPLRPLRSGLSGSGLPAFPWHPTPAEALS